MMAFMVLGSVVVVVTGGARCWECCIRVQDNSKRGGYGDRNGVKKWEKKDARMRKY